MDSMFWDERIETLPRETLERLQRHRLNWQLRRCWDGSPFYRERLEAAGLDPSMFADADILSRIPILYPRELDAEQQNAPPFGRLTVAPEAWWVETEQGRPAARRVWTDGDVSHRADIAARALWAPTSGRRAWGRIDPAIALGNGGDPHVLAALRDASHRIGRVETPSEVEGAVNMIWKPWPFATPDVDPDSFLVYGDLLVGPTLAYECDQRQGLHWAEDHFLPEMVDRTSFLPVPDDVPGVLVVTDLTREGSPLLRYPLGPVSGLDRTPCRCGRTSVRLVRSHPAGTH